MRFERRRFRAGLIAVGASLVVSCSAQNIASPATSTPATSTPQTSTSTNEPTVDSALPNSMFDVPNTTAYVAPQTTSRLIRWNSVLGQLDLLAQDLSVESSIHIAGNLTIPPHIGDAYLLAPSGSMTTTLVDFNTGTDSQLDVGGTSFQVVPGTPLESPWRLLSKDQNELFAVNVKTAEVQRFSQFTELDPYFSQIWVGGSTSVSLNDSYPLGEPQRRTAVMIDIDDNKLSWRTVDGFAQVLEAGFEIRMIRRTAPGSQVVDHYDAELWGTTGQIGQTIPLKSVVHVEWVQPSSVMIVNDGEVTVHNFETGTSETKATYDSARSAYAISPNLAFVSASGTDPGYLIDISTGQHSDLGDVRSFGLLGRQCYDAFSGFSTSTIVNSETGEVLAEDVPRNLVIPNLDQCTFWNRGESPQLVIDGRIIDIGTATSVTDLGDDHRMALIQVADGPAVLDLESNVITQLPAGEYRFIELVP
jgi:hypothetical protein